MATHSELSGIDLHEPSTTRILNSTSSELTVGQWVFLGVDENSDGFVPVTRLAMTGERRIGIVEEVNIATDATGVVKVFGRTRADTSTFTVGVGLQFSTTATSGFILATNSTNIIGIVLTSDANGTIQVDTNTSVFGATAGSLEQLNDVDVSTNLLDGQVIQYEASTSLWKNVSFAGGLIRSLVFNDTEGLVTITLEDGVVHVIQQGHRLYHNRMATTRYRDNWNLIGSNINFVDGAITGDTAVARADSENLYFPDLFNGESTLSTDNDILIGAGVGKLDGNTPLVAFRKLRGTDDEIVITSPPNIIVDGISQPSTDPNIFSAPEIPILASEVTSLTNTVNKLVLNDRVLEAEDVVLTDPTSGQVLELAIRAATFDFEFITSTDGSSVTLMGLNDEIISGASGPVINSLTMNVVVSTGTNENTITRIHGNTGINIEMNFTSATPSIDNIIDRLDETFNSNSSSSIINWDEGNGSSPTFVRTIDGIVYTMSQGFSKEANPGAVIGVRASRSLPFADGRASVGDDWNINLFSVDIADEAGNGHTVTLFPDNAPSSLDAFVAHLAARFNASRILTEEYGATASGAVLTITANEPGVEFNGHVTYFIYDNAGNPATDLTPSDGTFSLTGGTDSSATNRIVWVNDENTEIQEILASGNEKFDFKQGGEILINVNPPEAPFILVDIDDYNRERGNGWTPGQQFVTRDEIAVPLAAPIPAVAAEFRVTFADVTTNGTITTILGVVGDAVNNFFELVTPSVPPSIPNQFVMGAFQAQPLDTFLEQFENPTGTARQLSVRADTDPSSGAEWANNCTNAINAISTDAAGTQVASRGAVTTGGFYRRNCTATLSGRSVIIKANTGGATNTNIAFSSAVNITVSGIVQGVDEITSEIILPTNSLFVVTTPTQVLNVATGDLITVI